MVPYQSQVGYLRKLESLKLRYNLLSGSLPTELGRLNATQTGPYLFNNSFSGTLPTGRIPDVLIEASAATAKKKMRIYSTNFSGIVSIQNLETLSMFNRTSILVEIGLVGVFRPSSDA